MFRGAVLGGILAACAAVCLPLPAHAAERVCAGPDQTRDWERANPSELGLDGAKLQAALDFGDSRLSQSVLLIRHGCLAGISGNGVANYAQPLESWSMAKSMVSMTAMRAMTLGLLSPDDRLGALIPEADRAHGAITIRQLLQMSSGLHWNMLADYNIWDPDVVNHGLLLGFDDEPGTIFEYHQTGTALLTEAIERAVGEPFQQFVQRELFGPVGIPRSHWTWEQDSTGNTRGFFGLRMPATDYARLGQLMLREGAWNGRHLLDPWYVAAAHARSPNNPGYGWMFWRNDPDGYWGATIMTRWFHQRPMMPAVPMDGYQMSGLFDQQVVIIPSLDTVYVRMGLPSSDFSLGGLIDVIASSEGPYTQSRKLMAAFVSPKVPDPGPWVKEQEPEPVPGGRGLMTSLEHLDEMVAAGSAPKPALPPAGPARARVPATASGLLQVAGGAAALPVRCPPVGTLPCRGSLTLRTAGGRPLSRPAAFTLQQGEEATVRLPIPATARRRIAAAPNGLLPARITLAVGDSVERWISESLAPVGLTLAPS